MLREPGQAVLLERVDQRAPERLAVGLRADRPPGVEAPRQDPDALLEVARGRGGAAAVGPAAEVVAEGGDPHGQVDRELHLAGVGEEALLEVHDLPVGLHRAMERRLGALEPALAQERPDGLAGQGVEGVLGPHAGQRLLSGARCQT
jgi:hypothetical protein